MNSGEQDEVAARVLAVDDDPDMCDYLETALSRHGFEVVACGRPARAPASSPYRVAPRARRGAAGGVAGFSGSEPGIEQGIDSVPRR